MECWEYGNYHNLTAKRSLPQFHYLSHLKIVIIQLRKIVILGVNLLNSIPKTLSRSESQNSLSILKYCVGIP